MGVKSHTGIEFYPSLVSVIYKKIEKKMRLQNYPEISKYEKFDVRMF